MKDGKMQAGDPFEVRVNSVKPASLYLLISGREEPSMTDSRWELAIGLLVSSTIFWSVWHFVAQLLSWGVQAAA
ncbi:MAG: hypothetical protein WA864_14850 [Acetobacteraceae bacterium]